MRLLLSAMLIPAMLTAAEFPIDHVTVAGASITHLRAALSEVGIATVYGGPHADGATEMAMVSFPDGSYLELIALQPAAKPELVAGHVWAKYLRGNAGPMAWAVRAEDLAAEVKRLKAAGVAVSEPQRNGRARPDGVHLEWETATLGTEPRGTFFPFLIHDFTPREQRAFPQGKLMVTGFAGISRVVIGVHDLDESVKRYRQAYGLAEAAFDTDRAFGARLAMLPGSPVVLAQPLTADSWLGKRVREYGDLPCAFLLQATDAAHYKAASTGTWFGKAVSWLNPQTLGWRLGFEGGK